MKGTFVDRARKRTDVTDPVESARPARRRRRPSGTTTLLLAIILVLEAIAIVGDRVAAKFATDQLRTRLVAAVDDRGIGHSTIDVSIGGFPFLTQVARGRYDAIII